MNVVSLIRQKMMKTPWTKYYKKEDRKIKIEDISIYQMLVKNNVSRDKNIAINYYGTQITYKELFHKINQAANAFRSQGIRRGDIVTICMPNTPEALISFYAINKIGAIANMIHPLSGEQEIKDYLISTHSVMLIMIDICYEKVKNVIKETDVYKTIVTSASDSMGFLLSFGYQVTQGYKIKKPKRSEEYVYWKDFIRKGLNYRETGETATGKDTPAVILHSGGTTGNPKGIVLSNGNFNALSMQAKIVFNEVRPGEKVLAIMPIFHGFGLGVSINAPLVLGCEVILIPQFNAKKFDKLLEKYKPNVLFGVPTLFEALINTKNERLDLSMVRYVISGGDSLSSSLERRINVFLASHKARVEISQGYGMTESLAAVALAFGKANKPGSIGIPFPSNYIKIVKPRTQEEVPYGEDGEICISGPTVMLGYLDNEKETNEMLQIHKDGLVWLHTGDMGMMDEDGVVFYRQRIKRMIISSGYNIYPAHVEQVIEEHPAVLKCTVVGIPHPYKMEVPKAYIVLKNGYSPLGVRKSIREHCKKNLATYAIPYEFEYRKSLPKTLIGKVDFKKLQEENSEHRKSVRDGK